MLTATATASVAKLITTNAIALPMSSIRGGGGVTAGCIPPRPPAPGTNSSSESAGIS